MMSSMMVRHRVLFAHNTMLPATADDNYKKNQCVQAQFIFPKMNRKHNSRLLKYYLLFHTKQQK